MVLIEILFHEAFLVYVKTGRILRLSYWCQKPYKSKHYPCIKMQQIC